jgi:DNA-binding GntR family transcriptional regulator
MNEPALQIKPGVNLAELAYRQLTDLILERGLPGGTLVIEERIAEQLSLSRTPIREAILRLAAEGLLVKQGNRSFSVRIVTASEFFHSHKVRELLEPAAVEMAIGRIPEMDLNVLRGRIAQLATANMQERAHWDVDERLHTMFADGSGNPVLAAIIRKLRVTTRLFEISQPLRRVKKDGEEHLAIIDAFASGDGRAASRAMARHIRNLSIDTAEVLEGITRQVNLA